MKRGIDVGLAILSATTPPGVCRSRAEIAAFCDCTASAIGSIERRALAKLRAHCRFLKHEVDLPCDPMLLLGRAKDTRTETGARPRRAPMTPEQKRAAWKMYNRRNYLNRKLRGIA